MATEYSLDVNAVKKVIEDYKSGNSKDPRPFMFYHLHRNHFNVGREVTQLKKINDRQFQDNLGNIWEEQATWKNFFHMPKLNYIGSNLGLAKPYSRKFLRDDTTTGLEGEFEMIIRHDDKRVDALTHERFQETYNFGKTRNTGEHTLLDINPHRDNPNYAVKTDTGWVKIIE